MKTIKEGTIEAGKAIKSSYKDLIDQLPELQKRENNFNRLYKELSQLITDTYGSEEEDKIKDAQNKIKVIKMLQNEEQQLAIRELVKIENFSEDDMSRLMSKGLSTHEEDIRDFKSLMDKFQPAIMAIGTEIKEVEQKIDDKVKQMKPGSQLDSLSPEQVSGKETIRS